MILIVKIKRYRVCTNVTLGVVYGYVNKNTFSIFDQKKLNFKALLCVFKDKKGIYSILSDK